MNEPDRAQLRELVERIAADESAWRHLVRHEPDQRTYDEVMRTDQVGVWVICWMDDHDTGFHDHDVSAVAVAVGAGAVREERLVVGGGTVERV